MVLLTYIAEAVKEDLVNLGTKLLVDDHEPRTIIGKDYLAPLNRRPKEQSTPGVQGVVHGPSEEEWWKVESVAYGPSERRSLESEKWKEVKLDAWKNVLRSSTTDENQTSRLYVEAIRRVEKERFIGKSPSIRSYDELSSSDELIWIIIIDGCFLLQVALLVLGGSEQLNYYRDVDDPLFGQLLGGEEDAKVSMLRSAVSSMFFAGNQIPLVYLKELMNQSFFKNVLNEGIWEQPMDFERWVLFELLLVTTLDVQEAITIPTASLPDYKLFILTRQRPLISSSFWHSERLMGCLRLSFRRFLNFFKKKQTPQLLKANDLLHGLSLLMTTGLVVHSNKDDYDIDLNRDQFYNVVLPTMRSATELKEVGIVFRYNEGKGIDGIRFRKIMFNAFLFLPRIVIDADKEIFKVLRNLMIGDKVRMDKNRRTVCEYLRLMRELIRSPEDVKVLAASGIIVVDPHLEEEVTRLFHELPIPRVMRSDRSTLGCIRDELNNYTKPAMFKQLGDVLNFVLFLTLVQTVYAILTYHLNKK